MKRILVLTEQSTFFLPILKSEWRNCLLQESWLLIYVLKIFPRLSSDVSPRWVLILMSWKQTLQWIFFFFLSKFSNFLPILKCSLAISLTLVKYSHSFHLISVCPYWHLCVSFHKRDRGWNKSSSSKMYFGTISCGRHFIVWWCHKWGLQCVKFQGEFVVLWFFHTT